MIKIDAELMAKAHWPGLQALLHREMRNAIEKDVRAVVDSYYAEVCKHLENTYIEQAEFVDGKLILTMKT